MGSTSHSVHFSRRTVEWYTPPEVIERTVRLLGSIDLDPCSEGADPPNVPAAQHFTEADDGLSREWCGRVYMNPPYGRVIGEWVQKLVDEYRAGRVHEGIALVPARTDTRWFRLLGDSTLCFVRGRLRFSSHMGSAPFPSTVAYLGRRPGAFAKAFSDLGDVWVRRP